MGAKARGVGTRGVPDGSGDGDDDERDADTEAGADGGGRGGGGAAGPGEVRSVRRALQLLALFDAERPRASLSELARGTALAVSTVQRLLATLERERFVARGADGRYGPGAALVRIGLGALRAQPLHERAGPYLSTLAARTGETANLAVPEGDDRAVYLRQVLSPQSVRHQSWLGRPFPLERTAAGPALLGRVAADGRCATRVTREPDVSAVAAPVHGTEGGIVAALSVTGPSYRIDDATLERLGDAVVDVAREFSLALGGEWPYRARGGG